MNINFPYTVLFFPFLLSGAISASSRAAINSNKLGRRLDVIFPTAGTGRTQTLKTAALKREFIRENSPQKASRNAAGQAQVYRHYHPSKRQPAEEDRAAVTWATGIIVSRPLSMLQAGFAASGSGTIESMALTALLTLYDSRIQ
ncbi:MAG: hypothetical protein KGL13_05955 [Gammaproteobacteria bacterium]|nr:hypothetical protein [Gammaproteobacteria bacterium]MDE2345993.1 hypothetical protein [Gammaproteobacteria bacterium]